MKFKMKAVVAALAMVAAGGANAAINAGTAYTGAGQGELYFSVFDSVNQISYTRDLGVTIDQFLAGQNGSYSFAADAKLSSFINTANTSSSSLVWNLLGAMDSDFSNPVDFPKWGLYVTSNSGDAAVANVSFEQAYIAINQSALMAQGANGDAFGQGGGSGTNYALNNSATSTGGDGYYAGPYGGNNIGNSVVISDENVIGQSMAFYHVGLKLDVDGNPVTDDLGNLLGAVNKFAGKWTLAADGDLSYDVASVPAPVPLPPAVLLLGSALAGLVGIARRNRQQDEAVPA